MSKSNINVDAKKNEILNLVNKYSIDDNVDCLYFLPYIENGVCIFNLVIVFSKSELINEMNDEIIKLNQKYGQMYDELGGNLIVSLDRSDKYSRCAMHGYEIRRGKDLFWRFKNEFY